MYSFPLTQGLRNGVRVSRRDELIDTPKEPLDFRKARSPMRLQSPPKLLLGTRVCRACGRAESLRHESDDQGKRLAKPLQSLVRDQFLGASHPDRGVVSPIHDFKAYSPKMGGLSVVALEELPHKLSLLGQISRGGKENMVLPDRLWR